MNRSVLRLALAGVCLLACGVGQPAGWADTVPRDITAGVAPGGDGDGSVPQLEPDGTMVREVVSPPLGPLGEDMSALARRTAQEILRQEQFRRAFDKAPDVDPTEQLSAWLARVVRLIGSLSSPVQWTIVGLCMLALLGICIHLWYVLRRVLAAGSLEPAVAPVAVPEPEPDPSLERRRAELAASTGDYAGALRHLHRYLRLELDHRKLMPYHEQWTNWEYLQALSRSGLPMEPLRVFTARCDQVFYREARGTREDYEASLEALGQVFDGPARQQKTARAPGRAEDAR